VPAPVPAALPFRRVINTAIQIIRLPYSSRSVIILIGDLGHNPIWKNCWRRRFFAFNGRSWLL